MKHAIVTTTINVPHLLTDYCKDVVTHGVKDVSVIVSGDKKTPAEAASFCAGLEKTFKISVEYMGVEDQTKFLSKTPEFDRFLPWNCIQRRNVAMLRAYSQGADVIYTIDDDNFLETPNYIGSHGVLGAARDVEAIQSSSGWFNVCTYLEESRGRSFFHRGYSVKERQAPEPRITKQTTKGRVVVNAGLWLGDPDVDAVTRLAIAPDVTGTKLNGHIALAHNTRSPFNSQNTAFHRDITAAYCMLPGVGRYDDILASYFVKRIADHLGDYISFGLPMVRQNRNAHDLWIDADHERLGYQLTDRIVEWLYDALLKGKDYTSCMKELLPLFREKCLAAEGLKDAQKEFLDRIVKGYEAWLLALEQI